jgi:hypothetical protein
LPRSTRKVGPHGKRLRCLGGLESGPWSRSAKNPSVYRRFKNRSERHLIEVMVVPLSSVSGRAAHRLVQPVLSAQDTLLGFTGAL